MKAKKAIELLKDSNIDGKSFSGMNINDAMELLNEDGATTAGIASFVGRSGVGVDAVFAGGFHPEFGQIGALLQSQLDWRKFIRDLMIDAIGEENIGDELPLGGYYDMNTELLMNSYDELEKIADENMKYSQEHTPEYDTDWKESDVEYEYDEPGEAYKISNISYDEIDEKLDVEKWTNKTNKMKFVDIYKRI